MTDQTEPRCQECEDYGGQTHIIGFSATGEVYFGHRCNAEKLDFYTYDTPKPTRAWFCPRLRDEGEREQEHEG